MSSTEEKHLEDEIYNRIVELMEKGQGLGDKGDYLRAIERYKQAYDLLPQPREAWQAALNILGNIGDAYFLNRNYEQAFAAMNQALMAPGGIGNPFIHLRLGQSAYELEDFDLAKDELMRAYMGAGEEIFWHDHPKYLEFLAKHAAFKVTKRIRRRSV